MDILNELVKLGNDLDQLQMKTLADSVDGVLKRYTLVKEAQYVSGLGYWVRNSRCWANCYRRKRAGNPSKAANDVWWECQKEYQKALEADDTSWDKYASGDKMTKVAAVKTADNTFLTIVNQKVASGIDLGTAVTTTLKEGEKISTDLCLECANQLTEMASVMSKGQPEFAKTMASIATELSKEAAFPKFPFSVRAKGSPEL